MRSEDLVAALAADLRPVRRLAPPARQAAAWLCLAVAILGVAVAYKGLRPDLPARLLMPQEVVQWVASVTVGGLAALAAAMLARPDRPALWALLPLPAVLAWLGSLGWGCVADLARLGPEALRPATSWSCLGFIFGLGTPLAATLFVLLRHAGPVRPLPVLLLGALASAALCSAGLSLFHHLDAALMVLLWHGGAVLLVISAAALFGRPLLLAAPSAA